MKSFVVITFIAGMLIGATPVIAQSSYGAHDTEGFKNISSFCEQVQKDWAGREMPDDLKFCN